MRERKIDRGVVEYTINHAEQKRAQLSGRVQAVRRLWLGQKRYCIVVVYENLQKHRHVVTVFITSKVKKYFQP